MPLFISHKVTFFDCLFIDVREKNVFTCSAFFYPLRETQLICTGVVGPVMSLSVAFIDLYFICQKSSHGFLLIFFSVTEGIVFIEIMKQKVGVTVLVSEKLKGAFISPSSLV